MRSNGDVRRLTSAGFLKYDKQLDFLGGGVPQKGGTRSYIIFSTKNKSE